MSWPAPALLLFGPLVPALVTLLLRRWQRLSAGIGVLGAVILWWQVATVSLSSGGSRLFAGAELAVLGRSLTVGAADKAIFSLLYACLAGLMLLAIWWRQSRDFVPTSFVVLALLAGAVMARPFSFGVLFLLAAAAGTTIIIQSDRAGATDAAFRYLAFVTLATPLFLVSGWMLDSGQSSLQTLVWGLLLSGSTLLLAGFPFVIWVRPLVVTGSSLTPAFVLGLVGLGHLTFLLSLLNENAWVFEVGSFTTLMRASGLLTMVLGGVLALISRLPGNLLGALVLIDLGAAQIWLTLGDAGMASAAIVPRFIGLIDAGIGVTLMAHGDRQNDGRWARRLGLAAFLYGGLSLTGLPLTPAFWGRWQLVLDLGAQSATGTRDIALFLSSIALATLGLVQFARTAVSAESENGPAIPGLAARSTLTPMLVLTAVTLAVSLLLAIAPQLFWQVAVPLAGA